MPNFCYSLASCYCFVMAVISGDKGKVARLLLVAHGLFWGGLGCGVRHDAISNVVPYWHFAAVLGLASVHQVPLLPLEFSSFWDFACKRN